MADAYTEFAKGNVFIRALMDVDLGVGHVESFAAFLDAVAT